MFQKNPAQRLLEYLASLSEDDRAKAIQEINQGPADGPGPQLSRLLAKREKGNDGSDETKR